jgi:cyclopropane-fatty-acyl-phospholipid synthase
MVSTKEKTDKTMSVEGKIIHLAEAGLVPDFLLRSGIRRLCKKRLGQCQTQNCEKAAEKTNQYIESADKEKVALLPEKANEQHYEVPSAFYQFVLGPHLKYSCCEWGDQVMDLAAAEKKALELTCSRAKLEDAQTILELGCGWGSLSLWMAERYPESSITSLSNSNSQREFITSRAKEKNLTNLQVLTGDINDFDPAGSFDRVVSVEMFEHVRNHRELFRRIHSWLAPEGRLFTHVFCQRSVPYPFQVDGEDDWMSKHFFSGGTMPSDDLFLRIAGKLEIEEQHRWSGSHYARTSEEWLRNLDRRKQQVLALFRKDLDSQEANRTFHRWRLFFLACAETFGFAGGQEWWVSHYLFRKT